MADDAVNTGAARRERLAQRRKVLGLTQEDLACLLGVERSTVMRWERGDNKPQPWIRPRLAKALQVPTGRLEELLASSGALGGSGTEPGSGHDRMPVTPRQLPAAVADFTGRAAELQALTRILDKDGARAPGTVVISAIGGTAGVGKTALALHWAHQIAHRFPDGQLHVNLRGFDPSGVPVTPAEAVRGFLDALGVPPERVPPSPDAQAGLYRSLLAERKMLIVLDNARDERQVRALLPASPASLVVVTSRNQLTGLAATDSARLLSLDVLTRDEAVRLLTARVGKSRAAAEPDAVDEIAALCARLPLALAVTAARAAVCPSFPLAEIAAELRGAGGRLDVLEAGDRAVSVSAVFSWSYRQLSDQAARLSRLLGLHPGPDISVPAAASLAAIDEPQARGLLRELTRGCLITEHVPGRYTQHDLLRAYAADQARDTEGEDDRAAATGRLLDHYLHTSCAAALLLQPTRTPLSLAPPSLGAAPEALADRQQAMAWFQAEQDVLVTAIAHAAGSGLDRYAWQLPWAMAGYLQWSGHWHEQISILSTGLAAATRLGDAAGQAASRRLLAHAYFWAGDYGRADAHARHSMDLCRRLGDRLGEGKVHQVFISLAECQGRYADALNHCEQALHLYRTVGYTAGEAEMLNNVGWYHGLLGDYQQARAFCQRSIALSAELGHRHNQGFAWDSLGYVEHRLGNFSDAASCYERALSIFRDFGNRSLEAGTLRNLGDTHQAMGELARARRAWRQALAIYDEIQHADAEKVRSKLASLEE